MRGSWNKHRNKNHVSHTQATATLSTSEAGRVQAHMPYTGWVADLKSVAKVFSHISLILQQGLQTGSQGLGGREENRREGGREGGGQKGREGEEDMTFLQPPHSAVQDQS